jgi:hypothetical protein
MGHGTRLAHQLAALLLSLHEQPRRLLLATEARAWGRGGIARVARTSIVSCPTIHKGLDARDHPTTARIRQAGGVQARFSVARDSGGA